MDLPACLPTPATTATATNYVSLFRIDGVPILPPLMTTEKRRHMQRIREKAIKLEQQKAEKRSKSSRNHKVLEENMDLNLDKERSQLESSGSVTQRSYDYEATHQALEDSYKLLAKLVLKSESDAGDNSTTVMQKSSSGTERLQQLQKSETIIYDNRTNSVIVPLTAQEEHLARRALNSSASSPTHTESAVSPKQPIPAINIDPPTPLVGTRTFCGALSASESVDSIETQLSIKEHYFGDEFSIDDTSCNNSQANFPATLDDEPSLKQCVTPIKPPKRSATSPSLKADALAAQQETLTVTPKAQRENTLVRSNSFTLDGPSQVLLEHIRQQKQQQQKPCLVRVGVSPSASRDTVESKAKRVQKVELKRPTPPVRVQSRMALSNASSVTQLTSRATGNNMTKPKRSPYEQRMCCKPKLARQLKKSASCASSVTTAQARARPAMPPMTSPSPARLEHLHRKFSSATNTEVSAELLHEIEAEHRQQFLQLLAQQQEQQRRLQLAFEEQQNRLLQQLVTNMGPPVPSRNGLGQSPNERTPLMPNNNNSSGKNNNNNNIQKSYQFNQSQSQSHSSGSSAGGGGNTSRDLDSTLLRSPTSTSSVMYTLSGRTMATSGMGDLSLDTTLGSAKSMTPSPMFAEGDGVNRCTPRRRLFTPDRPTGSLGNSMASTTAARAGNSPTTNRRVSSRT